MSLFPVSVIFVTHNRKALLNKAIQAAYSQRVPVKVIVMDDASDDGTDEMILHYFPEADYFKSQSSKGPSFQRNEGAKRATSDIIFFLDDDTILNDDNTIEKTIADFTDPGIGAVAMPFINVLQNNEVQTGAPNTDATYIYHAFVAAAFAVRRSVFLQLGGFREQYFYMGEEGDFCIRLLQLGYYVKAGTCKPAHHYQPPGRISFKADFYGRRNDILFSFLNAPRLYMPINVIGSILKGIWFGLKVKRLPNMLKGIASGLQLLFDKDIKAMAQPVDKGTFLKYRKLKHHEPLQLDAKSMEASDAIPAFSFPYRET